MKKKFEGKIANTKRIINKNCKRIASEENQLPIDADLLYKMKMADNLR